MTTQHFNLQKISCPSCVMHLEAMEDDLDGVETVDVNFKRQTMKVSYREDVITPSGIAQAVIDMGYTATLDTTAHNNDKKGSSWKSLFRS